MKQEEQGEKTGNADEVSLTDIIQKVRSGLTYLRRKWLIIFLFGLLGGILGLAYAMVKKPVYLAACTFVLDEGNKSGAMGQYAGLASLAGIDIGSGGNSIFSGDNIIELYKSRLMIEKTLLSEADFNGKNELLIERYINYNKLRIKWKEKDHIDNITFSGNPEKFNRKQDSIITDLVETFNKKVLGVYKPDKKLSIIRVEVAANDELFAKQFTDKLVETVNDFYVQTKTKKTQQNVQILQKQADSVRRQLNSSISGVASAIDADPNANPSLLSLRVPSQRKQVDVQASTAIYAEIVKNLEVSKMALLQETPLIQVIDSPVLPLEVDRTSKAKSIIIGFILSSFICLLWLLIKKLFSNI